MKTLNKKQQDALAHFGRGWKELGMFGHKAYGVHIATLMALVNAHYLSVRIKPELRRTFGMGLYCYGYKSFCWQWRKNSKKERARILRKIKAV